MSLTSIFISGTIIIVLLNLVIATPKYRPTHLSSNQYERIATNGYVSRFSALFNTLLFVLLLLFIFNQMTDNGQETPIEKSKTTEVA